MLMEICAWAAGARARPTSNAVVETRVLSTRMGDPLKVSAVPFVAWDALLLLRTIQQHQPP